MAPIFIGSVVGAAAGLAQAAIKGNTASANIKQTLPASANNPFFFMNKNSSF
jgi:gas vesicle protein